MKASPNSEYFDKYCEILCYLLARPDKRNTAIKSIIRHTVREAANHASTLPGHDNKLGAEIVSAEALLQIQSGNISGLIGEHVIPVSTINNILLDKEKPSAEEIKTIIKKFSLRAVITVAEDRKLKHEKLTKTMPENWDGESLMDRYKSCNIATESIPYKFAIKNG